ncbi:MAG: hypothetical protein Q7T58_05115 [Methylotenera sp.]|nr:hypothetical protein [Methylotenera sp.]
MELYLQFGYGMMEHSRSLIKYWGSGTVILSPRDLNETQLERLSKETIKLGGSVVLDPQLYNPVLTNHDRLIVHSFWPTSSSFPNGPELSKCLINLIDINQRIGAKQIILPGMIAKRVDDDWLESQRQVIEESQRCDTKGVSTIMTVALSYDALRNDDQVQLLLESLPEWDVPSIYLVCEHPNGDYLVTDPGWLANVADVVAGIRLAGKQVIVGYCNHQMLLVASSAATAIASGTWMNVRSFNEEKFILQDDDEIKQRSIWYYAPHLFSEYKIGYLDLAKKSGVLDNLRTDDVYGSNFADELFTAPQPQLAGFTEQQAFRHYLQCLHHQATNSVKQTFDETIDTYVKQLDQAEEALKVLHAKGIKGQKRDFLESIDANRGAASYLSSNRGAVLRRKWTNLIS